MTGGLFLLALVGLPLVGAGPLLSRRLDWIPLGAAVALASTVGAVLLCGEMLALTVAGVRWNLLLLLIVPAIVTIALASRRFGRTGETARRPPNLFIPASGFFLLVALAALGIVGFAAMTARVTSTDLILFWGAKGEHFGLAARIDAAFLGHPDHWFLHPDYPPLWPCLYGFATLVAGRLAWGASLATLPLFLALSVLTVWSFARLRLGATEASAFAAVYASLFGFLLCDSLTAGNADPPLLFFETLALCLLVFARGERGAFLLAGVALAAATWLKLEGIAFGWAVILGSVLSIRPMSRRRFGQLAVPPVLAFVAWVAFCRAHGLVDALGAHKAMVLTGERFGLIGRGMLSSARMQSMYLPWCVAVFLLLVRRTARAAVFALLVAALVAAFDCGIYLTASGDPTVWIGWAGERTLLTPLLALLIAGMAPAVDSAGRREPLPVY